MSTTVVQMTVEELKALVRDTVKETFWRSSVTPMPGLSYVQSSGPGYVHHRLTSRVGAS